MNLLRPVILGLAVAVIAACGSGGPPKASPGPSNPIATPTTNVAAAAVNGGPVGVDAINVLYTTVTVCVPATTTCQAIDNVEIDTQSSGLRILASALTITLPPALDSNGNALAECAQFAGGTYSWGPLASADMSIAGESVAALTVEIIGGSSIAVPTACAAVGNAEDTVATFGANGILGVGTPAQDCGALCVASTEPGFYYACTATNCVPTTVDIVSQLQNPATLFATDNNGVIIELPSVSATGAASLSGVIVFGIDTATNNASSTAATVLPVQTATSYLSAQLAGQTYASSFLDTGSNALFFNDSSLTQCTNPNLTGFYCPASTENLSATLIGYTASGTGGTQRIVDFSIANTLNLLEANSSFAAFSNIGGTYDMTGIADTFDFGLPFFYGRNVYEVFEGKSSSVASGPYFAF
ncbi:MAG: DUF3443 family protein [Steroidobacteraceae bacterium]|jgi:hypothetical protein